MSALRQGFEGPRGVAFAWTALLAFVRAAAFAAHWLGHPKARVVHPGEQHADILGRLLRSAGTAGNLTMDAHLAAPAIEHGATIVSFDRDSARFADVGWTLPAGVCRDV